MTGRLEDLYDIRGNGVARLRMDKAVKDPEFRKTFEAMKDIPISNYNIELSYDSYMAGLAKAYIEGRDKAESNSRFDESEVCKEAAASITELKRVRGQL